MPTKGKSWTSIGAEGEHTVESSFLKGKSSLEATGFWIPGTADLNGRICPLQCMVTEGGGCSLQPQPGMTVLSLRKSRVEEACKLPKGEIEPMNPQRQVTRASCAIPDSAYTSLALAYPAGWASEAWSGVHN